MRHIVIKEARPGMVVARSIRHPVEQAVFLATAGEALTVDIIGNFHELGLYDLWVHDPGFDFLDDLCASQASAPQQRLADGLRASLLRFYSEMPIGRLKRHVAMIEDIFRTILRNAPAVPHFRALTEDEILLAHSCDVAIISIFLGLHLENHLIEQRRRLNCRQARELFNLAMGALFHDIGELVLPAAHRESSTSRGGNSDAWKQHTDEGFAIVRGHLDPTAAIVVQNHHQHFDGTGFCGVAPTRQQSGNAIHVFARIVMAAETFCLHHGSTMPQPMVKTLWQLRQQPLAATFDPVVHECLMQLFPAFVEGAIVTMADGRLAIIQDSSKEFPCFPKVAVIHGAGESADEIINTAEGEGAITSVDGTAVTDFLFGTRKQIPLAAA